MERCDQCNKKPKVEESFEIPIPVIGEYVWESIVVSFECDCGILELKSNRKLNWNDKKPMDDDGGVDIKAYTRQRANKLIGTWDDYLYRVTGE